MTGRTRQAGTGAIPAMRKLGAAILALAVAATLAALGPDHAMAASQPGAALEPVLPEAPLTDAERLLNELQRDLGVELPEIGLR